MWQRRRTGGTSLFLSGVGVGAGLLWALDPRRRAHARGKAVHLAHRLADAVDTTGRDLAHRASGVVAETRSALRRDAVPDDVLVARVRAKMGRVLSHPRAIDVGARDGRVTLAGPVLESERRRLLRCAARVRGVRAVEDRLEPHRPEERLRRLAGGRLRYGPVPALFRRNWAPTTRVVAGGIGLALGAIGVRCAGAWRGAPLVGLVGGGLLVRALTNLPARRLTGIRAGTRAVDVHKTIEVAAPIDEVFELFQQFSSFPRFMRHVTDVSPRGDGRWRWTVAGPARVPLAWDAEITGLERNRKLAWRTVPGSVVRHEGAVCFEETPRGTTRLDIRMSYNPPLGAVGDAVAMLFHADAKSALDDDLVRLKSLLEVGKATGRNGTFERDEITAK